MNDFATDLAQTKANRKPVMALRPFNSRPDELDDVVVKDVETVHFEAMSDDVFWMACYFHNGERVTFHFVIDKNPKRIVVTAGEMPEDWIDFDAK